MARKENTKAKEKKKGRKMMEMKLNAGWTRIKEAESQENPLSVLPSFTSFTKEGATFTLETKKYAALSPSDREWMWSLMETNMKAMYQKSDWGWNSSNKREEMENATAWYLVARTPEGTPVAFAHFRYDMECEDDVVYCYEIQLEEATRGKGLGKVMMKILELLMIKAGLLKVMLTVFKHNPKAVAFFKEGLKYELDETCPMDSLQEQFDYEILSRFNNKELARRVELEVVQE